MEIIFNAIEEFWDMQAGEKIYNPDMVLLVIHQQKTGFQQIITAYYRTK